MHRSWLFYPSFRTVYPQLSDSRVEPALIFESDPERFPQTLVISQVAKRGREFVQRYLENGYILFASRSRCQSVPDAAISETEISLQSYSSTGHAYAAGAETEMTMQSARPKARPGHEVTVPLS